MAITSAIITPLVYERHSYAIYSISSSPGSDVARLFAQNAVLNCVRQVKSRTPALAHAKNNSVCTRLQAASACLLQHQEQLISEA